MSEILKAVAAASVKEVDAGGLHWRIKTVSSADLARVGFAWLAMATPDGNGEDADDDGDMAKMLSRMKSEQMVELAKLKDAMIAAGLIAIGHGDEWDDVKITLRQSEEDADNGVLWVGSLPADVDNFLFTEIMSLSTDGGAAADRLAGFRKSGKRRNAGTSGRSRAKVRSTPAHGT
tara:strand:- start:762 stop:1289 length:528 start_codon:yes stop_codon:yes gene_type:complete